jgi:hypothetical protein
MVLEYVKVLPREVSYSVSSPKSEATCDDDPSWTRILKDLDKALDVVLYQALPIYLRLIANWRIKSPSFRLLNENQSQEPKDEARSSNDNETSSPTISF